MDLHLKCESTKQSINYLEITYNRRHLPIPSGAYAIDSQATFLLKFAGVLNPSLQFEEGIEKTVLWYLDNQPWPDNITSGEFVNYHQN